MGFLAVRVLAGFVGRWATNALTTRGAEVVRLSRTMSQATRQRACMRRRKGSGGARLKPQLFACERGTSFLCSSCDSGLIHHRHRWSDAGLCRCSPRRPDLKARQPSPGGRGFVAKHNDFVLEEPRWIFNQSTLAGNVTHWPNAWLKRVRQAPHDQSNFSIAFGP
jgi:hypothetical protein